MPILCMASAHAILRKNTHSDQVTQSALAARNNEAYGQGKRQRVVLYSPSLPDTGILLLAVLTLELEMDYPSETSLCTVATSPTDTPPPIFSDSEGKGRLYTGYLKWIIHLQTVSQN